MTLGFGGRDSGVANPAKPGGVTLLDGPGAVPGQGGLVARVRSTVNAWVSEGLLSRADGDKVVATAGAASYKP
ncbi:hypothetical protein AB0D62_27535 [Streptomyces massasporeus]|uniref:hypothetical protein n=1 Tax=Streptomyces massasporeus TaxID=67324 RepID=UPI0033C2CD3C